MSEIHSPTIVSEAAGKLRSLGLLPGFAFDLSTKNKEGVAWGFTLPECRAEARKRVKGDKSMFVIGSPPCTRWSSWQALNDSKRNADEVNRLKISARVHLEFVRQLYTDQVHEGATFFTSTQPWRHHGRRTASQLS